MKLDVKAFRYLTREDWRVLMAFEQGTKNHEVVPTQLAIQLSGLRTGSNGVNKSISTLARAGLVAKVKNAKYDGYRLTYGGLDYLALHSHTRANAIIQLGSTMGVGKESDIWLVTSPSPASLAPSTAPTLAPVQCILKIHRLGRTSFRTASTNRSYQGKNDNHCSWQHLSCLSAQKEYSAMQVLRDAGYRVPRPISQNRHTVVMGLVPGMPLRQVPLAAFGRSRAQRDQCVAALYADLIEVILGFAERGLIHGDMNEFNVLVEGVPEDFAEVGEEESELQAAHDDSISAPETLAPEDQPQDDGKDDVHSVEALDDEIPSLLPHIIDFPQITSMSHNQAGEYFERDIRGIKSFFRKRYHFEPDDAGPTFNDARARLDQATRGGLRPLDVDIRAAGFDRKSTEDLEACYAEMIGQLPEDDDVANNGQVDDAMLGEHEGNGEDGEGTNASSCTSLDMAANTDLDQLSKLTMAPLASNMETLALSTPSEAQTRIRPKTKAIAGWSI